MCARVRRTEKLLTVLKIFALAYVWLVLPVLLGRLWELFQKEEHNSCEISSLLGMLTVWAVFFVVARQAMASEWKLSELSGIWGLILLLMTVAAASYLAVQKKLGMLRMVWNVKNVHWIILALVILMAAAIFSVNDKEEHMVEEVLTMYTTDSLYEYSPMNGKAKEELLSIEVEELETQAQSPISAYYSTYVSMTQIYPAGFVRILLPIFLLSFYFCVYAAWGNYLFPTSPKKRYLFQAVVWLLYGTTLVTERTVMFRIFANCWNGETLFFLGVLPIAVLLLLGEKKGIRELEDFKKPYLISEYVVCAAAGQLLCTKGFFFVTFVWGIALVAACIKRWKDGSSITTVEG